MTTTQIDPRLTIQPALDEETARAIDALICHDLVTPDGRNLTEMGRAMMDGLIQKYMSVHREYIVLLRQCHPDAAKYVMLVTLTSCALVGDTTIPEYNEQQ